MHKVQMCHPDLPAEQTITVGDRSVAHYRASGWVPLSERPKPAPTPAAAPVPAPAPAPADAPGKTLAEPGKTTDRPRPAKTEGTD